MRRIYWHKRLKKWMVNIWFDHRNIHIGYFDNQEDAVAARDKVLKQLYGEEGFIKETEKKKTALEQAIEKVGKDTLLNAAKEASSLKDTPLSDILGVG